MQQIREQIYKTLAPKFEHQSFDLSFKEAFVLYDRLCFGMQVSERIRDRRIKINLASNSMKYALLLLIAKDSIRWLYNLDIIRTFPGIDLLTKLLFVLERSILYLLMILWDQLNQPYEKLYECIAKSFFDITAVVDSRIGIVIIRGRPPLLTNWQGSCYLDSLLAALLLSKNDFYRNELLLYPTTINSYPHLPCNTSTKKEMNDYAGQVQSSLKAIFRAFTEGSTDFQCIDIRKLLVKCIPSIFPFQSYNVSEVYDALSDIFPKTKMNLPMLNGESTGPISAVQMWDFIDPDTRIDWSSVDAEHLVFQNGLTVRLKEYDTLEPESVVLYGAIEGEFQTVERDGQTIQVPKFGPYKETIYKARVFGSKILGKYTLNAAVLLHGAVRMEGWGGGHYSAYIKRDDDWVHYDDIGPSWDRIEGFPKDVFKDTQTQRAELLFYNRLD